MVAGAQKNAEMAEFCGKSMTKILDLSAKTRTATGLDMAAQYRSGGAGGQRDDLRPKKATEPLEPGGWPHSTQELSSEGPTLNEDNIR